MAHKEAHHPTPSNSLPKLLYGYSREELRIPGMIAYLFNLSHRDRQRKEKNGQPRGGLFLRVHLLNLLLTKQMAGKANGYREP